MPKRTGASGLHGKTIDVLGYEIRIEERAIPDFGESRFDDFIIILQKGQPDPIPTLIHEVLEIGLDLLGYDLSSKSEEHKLICACEAIITQSVRNNPEIYGGLLDK